MSVEENKAIVRHLLEGEGEIEEAFAPDVITYSPSDQFRGTAVTSQQIKQEMASFHIAFPDFHYTIEDLIAEGDKVWHRFTTTGTHTGEFVFGKMTLPPTGKSFSMTGVNFWRIVDGKAVEKEGVYDQLEFFKQLGIISYTDKAKKLFPEEGNQDRS